jgi:putative DNA primase/helicase
MATFDIGNGGLHVYAEGIATALTAQLVISTLKIPYTIHCCFSAGNLKKVALKIGSGIILADHDESKVGENSAKDTGLKYFMSPVVGEDFNDYWLANRTFKASMEIKKLIYK